jgi:hypothetical protein
MMRQDHPRRRPLAAQSATFQLQRAHVRARSVVLHQFPVISSFWALSCVTVCHFLHFLVECAVCSVHFLALIARPSRELFRSHCCSQDTVRPHQQCPGALRVAGSRAHRWPRHLHRGGADSTCRPLRHPGPAGIGSCRLPQFLSSRLGVVARTLFGFVPGTGRLCIVGADLHSLSPELAVRVFVLPCLCWLPSWVYSVPTWSPFRTSNPY